MARPRRYVVAGAWYHVTTRGNNNAPCFLDDHDRMFLNQLRRVVRRYRWRIHACSLSATHYELVVQTLHANLRTGCAI